MSVRRSDNSDIEEDEIDLNCTNVDYGRVKKEPKREIEEEAKQETKAKRDEEVDQNIEPQPRFTPDEESDYDDDDSEEEMERRHSKPKKNVIKRGQVHQRVHEQMAKDEIRKILDAVQDDNDSFQEGKPCFKKYLIIPSLLKKFSSKSFLTEFLDYRGLEVVYKLIKRLPDGTLPLNRYREKIFKALKNFPVESRHLKKATVLTTELNRLLKSKKESKESKEAISSVIAKWSRTLCEKITDYAFLEDVEKFYEVERFKKDRKKSGLLKKRSLAELNTGYDRHRVYLPKRMGYQFFRRPLYQNVIKQGEEHEKHRIMNFISDMKKREKKRI